MTEKVIRNPKTGGTRQQFEVLQNKNHPNAASMTMFPHLDNFTKERCQK